MDSLYIYIYIYKTFTILLNSTLVCKPNICFVCL
jgi:hypothetical protein